MGLISGWTQKKLGIISGTTSFMGQFEDHLGVGIISEAVQVLEHSLLSTELYNDAPRSSLGTFAH